MSPIDYTVQTHTCLSEVWRGSREKEGSSGRGEVWRGGRGELWEGGGAGGGGCDYFCFITKFFNYNNSGTF